jgi:mannose-6-phosphate isomerase-like protein (cupin superfamily)
MIKSCNQFSNSSNTAEIVENESRGSLTPLQWNKANQMNKINLLSKFKRFNDTWSPKVIAEMNEYQFKLAKIENEFIWHTHEETDEVFIVLEGKMGIEFEDETVELEAGEMIVVPKGKRHKPFAEKEAKIMLVEPRGVVNTGDVKNELTAENDQWI